VLAAVQPPAPPSVADELARLGELRLQGVLSEAEFTAAKARILERGGASQTDPAPLARKGTMGLELHAGATGAAGLAPLVR
jgi:hypothetical protein